MFHHFRNKNGAEVDIVLERGVGEVVGIEIKAAATVTAKDFRGLRKLKEAAGDRFVAGVVLVRRTERGRLWRLPPRSPNPCTMGDHLKVEMGLPALSLAGICLLSDSGRPEGILLRKASGEANGGSKD